MELKTFEKQYPHISRWVDNDGTIEVGYLEYKKSIAATALDEGGVVWEGENFNDIEIALNALNLGIKKWIDENY